MEAIKRVEYMTMDALHPHTGKPVLSAARVVHDHP
jgi:hypothetical protein